MEKQKIKSNTLQLREKVSDFTHVVLNNFSIFHSVKTFEAQPAFEKIEGVLVTWKGGILKFPAISNDSHFITNWD